MIVGFLVGKQLPIQHHVVHRDSQFMSYSIEWFLPFTDMTIEVMAPICRTSHCDSVSDDRHKMPDPLCHPWELVTCFALILRLGSSPKWAVSALAFGNFLGVIDIWISRVMEVRGTDLWGISEQEENLGTKRCAGISL